MSSTKNIHMMTLNVRGLNNRVKRNNIFQWIIDNKCDIAFLQETYCTNKLEPILTSDWGGTCVHNVTSSNHSRGVSILFNQNLPVNVIDVHRDRDGRKLLVNIDLFDKTYTLVNIYAPNCETERIIFFKRATKWIRQYCKNDQNCIIAGDFNCCVGISDRIPDTHRNDKSRKAMSSLVTILGLHDLWTQTNCLKPGFTFCDKRTNTKSRLDYIFTSVNCDMIQRNSKLLNPIDNHHGDHKVVQGKFSIKCNPRGKGYWKFNSEILQDQHYCDGIRTIIHATTDEFRDIESKRMLWEMLKHKIKHYTISACIRRANRNALLRTELQEQIDKLTDELDIKWTQSKATEKSDILQTLPQMYIEHTNGAYVRSRAKYIEKDERSIGYFQRMEKSHQTYNSIKSLKSNGDQIVHDDIEILKIAQDFYKTLYSSKGIEDERILSISMI